MHRTVHLKTSRVGRERVQGDLPNLANSSRHRNSRIHRTDPSLHESCDLCYTHRAPPISSSKSFHRGENTRDPPSAPRCLLRGYAPRSKPASPGWRIRKRLGYGRDTEITRASSVGGSLRHTRRRGMGRLWRRAAPKTTKVRRPPVSRQGRLCFLSLCSGRSRREGKSLAQELSLICSFGGSFIVRLSFFGRTILITTTPRFSISTIFSLERLARSWNLTCGISYLSINTNSPKSPEGNSE